VFPILLYSIQTGKTVKWLSVLFGGDQMVHYRQLVVQARIPKIDDIESLISKANQAGWGN